MHTSGVLAWRVFTHGLWLTRAKMKLGQGLLTTATFWLGTQQNRSQQKMEKDGKGRFIGMYHVPDHQDPQNQGTNNFYAKVRQPAKNNS